MGNKTLSQLFSQRSSKWLVLLLATITASGCGLMDARTPRLQDVSFPRVGFGGSGGSGDPSQPSNDLIAANLVNTIVQLPALDPKATIVQMQPSSSEFDLQLKLALANRGYQIDPVSQNDSRYVVTSEIENSSTATGRYRLYTVNVGSISVSRAYELSEGVTRPVSTQRIKGARESSIVANDIIFRSADEKLSKVVFQPLEEPERIAVAAASIPTSEPSILEPQQSHVQQPVQHVQTPSHVEASVQQQAQEQEQTAELAQVQPPASNSTSEPPNLLAATGVQSGKQNLYEIGQSNYVEVFDGYEDIEQSILIFANDSLRLGDSNKQIIDQFVSNMNPETDVLSVIGCSIGATDIKNGNSLLALGRANRVKEAFLFSGLEHDQILEEGCWAPEAFSEALPHRGVVVTLKRQKSS